MNISHFSGKDISIQEDLQTFLNLAQNNSDCQFRVVCPNQFNAWKIATK